MEKRRGKLNTVRPEMLVLFEHPKIGLVRGKQAWAIALVESFVRSKDASEPREQ